MKKNKTIYNNDYYKHPKKPSESGIYVVYYGEYEDEQAYYFTSYEEAEEAMVILATDYQYGDTVYGPYPLHICHADQF